LKLTVVQSYRDRPDAREKGASPTEGWCDIKRRLLAFGLAIAATTLMNLMQVGVIEPNDIDDRYKVVLALVAAAGTALAFIWEISRSRDHDAAEAAETHVMTLHSGLTRLRHAAKGPGASVPLFENEDIGYTVFRKFYVTLPPFVRQVRVLRFRLSAGPRPTTIKWTRWKGPLGEAWDCPPKPIHFDHEAFNKRMENLSWLEWWFKTKPKERMHLSRRDFRQLRGYGFVSIHPILVGGRYWGALCVQAEPSFRPQVERAAAQKLMNEAASQIGQAWALAKTKAG